MIPGMFMLVRRMIHQRSIDHPQNPPRVFGAYGMRVEQLLLVARLDSAVSLVCG